MISANVSAERIEYTTNLPSQVLMGDVLDCQQTIRDKGETYLPKLTDQTDAQYLAYKNRASFPLYTKHVLTTLVGMALRKDLMLTNIPKELSDNIDGAGTNITAYTKALLKEFLSFGRCFTLIDYSSQSSKKKRSKLILYNHLSLINWRTRIVDDVLRLSLVVLKEWVDREKEDDEFTTTKEPQYRVLSLDKETNIYTQRIYNKDQVLIEEITPKKDRKVLDFIPGIIHGGIDIKKPPLLSIAEQNIAWYQVDADYRHGIHYVALPTPGTIGVDPDDVNAPKSIGPTKLWYLPEGASAFMLEFSGEGMVAVKTAKNDIEEVIITLSSRILSPNTEANETATAASIRNAGETASLADIVKMLGRELTFAVNVAVNWDNVVEGVEAVINTDFIPTVLSGGDASSYGAMMNKGTLSSLTLFDVCKQGELIKGDRSYEEEQAIIKKDQDSADEREIKKARDIAYAEAEGAAEVSKKYGTEESNNDNIDVDDPNVEDGKVAKDSDNLQGKNKEQTNKAQGQKQN